MDDGADFIGLLKVLVDREVDFIAVGDVAGILDGSPVVTVVLEVTCQPSTENLSRLHQALKTLNARHYLRFGPGAELQPSELAVRKRHTLVTDLERIDVVQEFDHGLDYVRNRLTIRRDPASFPRVIPERESPAAAA